MQNILRKMRQPYQYAILVFLIITILSSWFAYKNLRSNCSENITIDPSSISAFHNLTLDSNNPQFLTTLTLIEKEAGLAELRIDLQPNTIRTGVIELEFDNLGKVWRNKMYLRATQAVSFEEKLVLNSLNMKSNRWLPLKKYNNNYRIPLYRDITKSNVILQFKYKGSLDELAIKSIHIKPATFYDFPAGGLLICIGIIIITFLPGFIVASAVPQINILPLPILAFLISTPINLFALALCKVTEKFALFTPAVILLTIILLIILKPKAQSWKSNFATIYKNNIPDLNVWVCTLVMICITISFVYPSAVNNIAQGHITSEHTFQAFGAHDSVFQYFNGKAILENDFKKYYGTGELFYFPQDREILPGLSYAATILFMKSLFGEHLSQKYFPYAVFFLVSHALMLSMLFAWFRPLNISFAYITTLFIGTTPLFWTLGVVGWFKLTGAALILAGVYVIKNDPKLISRWVIAGILFGLAKNYHGGNALILPILTIWLLYRTYKTDQTNISFKQLGISFLSITSFACLLIYPWNWFVKNVWNLTSHKLFSQHFLGGHYDPASLLQSITLLFKNVPLTEQLEVRLDRTLNLFSLDWFTFVLAQYEMLNNGSIAGWLKFSVSYFLPALLPYALLALCIVIVIKIFIPKEDRQALDTDPWFTQFGWVCFINIIFLTFISYGRSGQYDYAGITWEIPTLLLIGILFHFVHWSTKIHSKAILVWLCVCFLQIGMVVSYG